MTGTLTFIVGPALATLVKHAAEASQHWPTFDQMFEGACRKDGQDLDVDHILNDDGGAWPTSEDVDPSKVPAGLVLVKDQGAYLMSNGLPELLAVPSDPKPGERSRRKVVYARGCDPNQDPAFYERALAACGGDDFSMWLPLAWFRPAIDGGCTAVELVLKENSVEVRYRRPPRQGVTRSVPASVADSWG